MRRLSIQLTYLVAAIIVHDAAGFTFSSPALNGLATPKIPNSSTCLNAFGIRTVKRILSPKLKIKRKGRLSRNISEEEVRSMFTQWNEALATGDSRNVANLYSSDPLLLPTVSDTPRTNFEGIKDYFDNFLTLKPDGQILEGKIKIGKEWAQDAGIYEFTMGVNGSKLKARYSFVYVWEDGYWKIAHHHSSNMPESQKKMTASKAEVTNLFDLWNDALLTGDPDAVARRYSKDAVLLPTVSDTPRSDYEGIKDYFVNFLKLEPNGEILESYITCGDNWCKDVGIYEFLLGTTGEKVRARYSFVYAFEDGEWKISHHHSSRMPEASAPGVQRISEEEVRSLFGQWNDALLTLDPDQVAKRYSKNAVLLSTASDRIRYTSEAIRDYFVNFQQKHPIGKILESHVTTGDNWCKDVGMYQFHMALTGETIMARYSFVYTHEDGEWKISHHHSSVMPEGMLAAASRLYQMEESDCIGPQNTPNETFCA